MSENSIGHRFSLHGGDLAAARAVFPDAPEPWIDLSTGINPVPYPIPDLPERAWTALPGRAEADALLAAAAVAYDTPAERIVAAPGTQALIEMLPRILPARRVAVLGPTYGEHAKAWTAAGATVVEVGDPEAAAGADAAVVVNPNNPDGRMLAPADLRALSARVGHLVVDEAFADLVPALALAPGGLPDNAVVLRSFGKTYGLAGLRLGFAIARPDRARRIEASLGPWAVAGPALAIGAVALCDRAWLERTAARLAADAARLDRLLTATGLSIVGGTPLYRLAQGEAAPLLFRRLAARGILTRPFAHRPDWLRFGLPAGEGAWTRLAETLHA